jgi:hypothetical protein
MPKLPNLTFNHLIVLALLGLSVYLRSPSVACSVVLVLAIKEGRETYEKNKRQVDLVVLERKMDEVDSKIRSFQNDVNRVVVKQAQYFGE